MLTYLAIFRIYCDLLLPLCEKNKIDSVFSCCCWFCAACWGLPPSVVFFPSPPVRWHTIRCGALTPCTIVKLCRSWFGGTREKWEPSSNHVWLPIHAGQQFGFRCSSDGYATVFKQRYDLFGPHFKAVASKVSTSLLSRASHSLTCLPNEWKSRALFSSLSTSPHKIKSQPYENITTKQ